MSIKPYHHLRPHTHTMTLGAGETTIDFAAITGEADIAVVRCALRNPNTENSKIITIKEPAGSSGTPLYSDYDSKVLEWSPALRIGTLLVDADVADSDLEIDFTYVRAYR